MLFPTTIAGSLPKPEWLAEPNMLWAPWKSTGDELRRAKRDATLLAVKLQEDAGIDIVTDGEQSRQHFVHGFLEAVNGIDFGKRVGSLALHGVVSRMGHRPCKSPNLALLLRFAIGETGDHKPAILAVKLQIDDRDARNFVVWNAEDITVHPVLAACPYIVISELDAVDIGLGGRTCMN